MPASLLHPASARPSPRARRIIAVALLIVSGVYGVLLLLLWWGQERLLFQPQILPSDHRYAVGADVHESWIDVPGARLNALHLQLPHPDGVVFFLHGNGGSLDNWFVNPEYYRRLNLDLFMIDYRGYGKSSGRIGSQAQLQADVRAAWDQVAPRYAGLRRVIYGRSLGSGLAAALAAEVQPELTVLVSPYASMVELAHEHYPWVPAAVLRYPLRSDLAVPRIRGPLLLVHGGRDTLIAPLHSQRLHELAPLSRLLIVPEAAHNDLQDYTGYLEGLAAALAMR